MKPRDGRYGVSSMRPRGTPEDPRLCVEEVWNGPRGMTSNQCSRKRGHGPGGLWCKQHARRVEETIGRITGVSK